MAKADWKIESRIVEFEDLDVLRLPAKRERLSFKPTQRTTWFGLYFDKDLAGCGAVIWGDKAQTWARLKSDLILPEWRGLGGYHVLNTHRICHAFLAGAEYIQIITRHRDVFLKQGWYQVGERASLLQLDRPA